MTKVTRRGSRDDGPDPFEPDEPQAAPEAAALNLKATVALSPDALAALLAEAKAGAPAGDPLDAEPAADDGEPASPPAKPRAPASGPVGRRDRRPRQW